MSQLPIPSSDGHHTRADLRLIAQAAREGWGVKPEWKQALPARLAKIVADPNTKPREVIASALALRAMDRDNFDKIHAVAVLEAKHAEPRAATSSPVTVNVGVAVQTQQAVPDHIAKLAQDPEKFRAFAKLAASLNTKHVENEHINGHANGHTNGQHHTG